MGNTKDIIADEYIKLIRAKEFDKITINDIITNSGVSRHTFYYYFKDKYDILAYDYKKKVIDNLRVYDNKADLKKYIKTLIEYTHQNIDIIKKIKTSKYSFYIENLLMQTKMEDIHFILDNKSERVDVDDFYIEILTCAYGNFSCRNLDKNDNDFDELADKLVNMIHKNFVKSD